MTTEIQEYTKTDAALAELRSRHANVVHDATTPQGMVVCRAGRSELRKYRTDLEKTRVTIKAPALERCRAIDTEAKRITAELWAMEEPYDAAIKAVEEAEEREKQRAITEAAEKFNRAEAARKAAEQAVLDAERAELRRMREELEAQQVEAQRQRDDADRIAREDRDRLETEARTLRETEEKRLRDERLELERQQAAQRAIEQAEADRKAKIDRDRLDAEAEAVREAEWKIAADAIALDKFNKEVAAEKRLADLKANAPKLRVAAIEAHALLCKYGLAGHDITISLGFAIEADARPIIKRKAA